MSIGEIDDNDDEGDDYDDDNENDDGVGKMARKM